MGTHFKGHPDEARALDTFIKLTRANRSVHAELDADLVYYKLTENQLGVLDMLHHLGSLCQTAIAEKLLTSPGNVTLLIDGLEKRGLVSRKRDVKDRRFITVYLTAAGDRVFSEVFPKHASTVRYLLDRLTPKEQEELGGLCKKLGTEVKKLRRHLG